MIIERIIEISAKNKVLVFFITAALAVWGWQALKATPKDAIPDLSDTQVIIYSTWDQSPQVMEDQVTYPIISALLGAPKVKDIRATTDYGYSFISVIFEDGTDIYWARSRTLEYLSNIEKSLPQGVKTRMGPDATGVGWIYEYVLVDETGQKSLADLRSLQDWQIKFLLQSVPGVAEVATVGGFEKQYQITLNPRLLFAYNLSIEEVAQAAAASNQEASARVLEVSGTEYMIRAKGYVGAPHDLENAVVALRNGQPIRIKDVAHVEFGPDMRRSVADFNGLGDVVTGIIVMRQGEDVTKVTQAVQAKIAEINASLLQGVQIKEVYNRSGLIERAIQTLTHELWLEMALVALVIVVFLLHLKSALIPIITLPLAVLLSFIPMHALGISANIMSLGGIAIAIGAMVDAAIVITENVHKRLHAWQMGDQRASKQDVIIQAIAEVGPASFYSLLIIAVSFLPIFALTAQEGRLFKPLAWTKNLSMLIAALLTIFFVPAARVFIEQIKERRFRPLWLSRWYNTILVGTYHDEDHHPLSGFLFRIYRPVAHWSIRHRWWVLGGALLLIVSTIPVYLQLGSEFMPPLNEGSILFMPTTAPGISVAQAQNTLSAQDQVLKSFNEVETVLGKAGRADTATDPAPLSMFETLVILKPESEWASKSRWFSKWPAWLKAPLAHFWPEHISYRELVAKMDEQLQFVGTTNAFTMPIHGRIDMLNTGIRTPVGIKIMGDDVAKVQEVGVHIEQLIKNISGTRSVFAERAALGRYLDVQFNRTALARYGITLVQAQSTLALSVGGATVGQSVEGRARYGIFVRYARDFRSDPEAIGRSLIKTASGSLIPLSLVAKLTWAEGPAMIRDDNGQISSYVLIDTAESDLGGYIERVQKVLSQQLQLPPKVTLAFSGQYESMKRASERLETVIPLTLALILLLLFLNTRSWAKTALIALAVPFSAIGAVWLLYLLGYNMSVAVWVGIIALLGVDAETGVFMLLFLDMAYERRKRDNRLSSFTDLEDAIIEGAVGRVRPKVMTVATLLLALLPILLASSSQAGADVMKRIAAPMLGGIFTSFLLELVVYPAVYAIWKSKRLKPQR